MKKRLLQNKPGGGFLALAFFNHSLIRRPCLMKPLFPVAFLLFLTAGPAVLQFPTASAQTDLPLPTSPNPDGGGGLLRLQRPAPPIGNRLDPFSEPAPLPLPPEPPPFPEFAPRPIAPGPPEVDLRKRANASLVPDGPNPTEDAAIQLRDRVRYRELKARVMMRPEIRSSLGAVSNARSDRELREAWRQHYACFFSAMRSLDKSLEPLIAQREKEALTPLQERLPRPVASR